MKNRSKLIVAAAALALGCTLLSGCGSSSSPASSAAPSQTAAPQAEPPAASSASALPDESTNGSDALADAVASLLEANPISNQFEIAAFNLEYDFNLPADVVESYRGVKSNDNGDAGLVLVIRPAAGKAQDVADALTLYKQDQVAFYGNYAEFAQAQANVENALISGTDELVVMVVASNECSQDLAHAVSAVLNP